MPTKTPTTPKKVASRKSTVKVGPTEISISGDMYECMFLSISKDQFKELASIGNSDGDDDLLLEDSEAWMELEDEIMGDSKINGFTFDGSGANFNVTVGSEQQIKFVEDFIKENSPILNESPLVNSKSKTKSYYLILEKWSKRGQKSVTIKSKFDASQLNLNVDDCVLPTGKNRVVADLSYGVEDLNFEQSFTTNEELYVYCSDGQRVNLEI
jgi:hypothetical protein